MKYIIFLFFIPVFSFAQKDFYYYHDSSDSATWETIQPLNRENIKNKTDTVLVDCLCVDRRFGLIIQKKKRQRTLQWQKVVLPSTHLVYSFTYDFVPIQTKWIDDVDGCYILTKAIDSD